MSPQTVRPPRRLAAIALLAVALPGIVLLAVGCASTATVTSPPVLVARDSANGKTMRVSVGERLEVILASSYWQVDPSSAPAVLRQDGQTSLLPRPTDCPMIPGLGCVPQQTSYTALKTGTAVITASRTSCGEALRCGPNQSHFRLTVIVG